MAFFAIWWAWLNFTWFASAYDTAYDTDDEAGWRTALRHTLALTVIQIGWIVRLFTPGSWGYTTFAICAIAELSGPYWAEHADRMTTWHSQHIAEHHGLFTIIVLGECVHSAFVAINAARTSASGISAHLAVVAGAGLQCMFGVWWIYFQPSAERMLEQRSQLSFVWGYGHSFLCASIAALGAGIALVASLSGDTAHDAPLPVRIAMLFLALMRPMLRGLHAIVDSIGCAMAALVVAAGFAARSIGLSASQCSVAAIAVGRVAMLVLVDDRVDDSTDDSSFRSTSVVKLDHDRRVRD